MSSSVITDADLLMAMRNRDAGATPSKVPNGNLLYDRGSFLDSLFSLKLRVPRVNANHLPDNYKRAATIQEWSADCAGIACNDIRLFPIVEEVYHNLGLPIAWEESYLPADKLTLKLFLPQKMDNSRTIVSKTLQLLELFFHIRVENHTHICNDECNYSHGSLGNRWHYPSICSAHLKYLTVDCIKKLADNKKVELQYINRDSNERLNNHVRILSGLFRYYRPFKPYTTKASTCVICKKEAPNTDYLYLTDSICTNCFKKIDWDKFQVYYKSSLVSWEELFSSEKIQQKYLRIE